jgi:anti-sigma factor RsiW
VTVDWNRLNAYVDRELDPVEAAEVAAAIARDPHLAARVATLSRLKAVSSGLLPPEMPPALPHRAEPQSTRRLASIAASVVLTLIGAAVGLWLWSSGPASRIAWLDEAVAAHRAWLDQGSTPDSTEQFLAAFEAQKAGGFPDLSEAHLTLVYVSAMPGAGDRPGHLIGYEGIHGCHVGLWIGAASPALGAEPVVVAVGGIDGYAWASDGIGYALLARGMDPARLEMLAAAVARITQADHRIDDQTRTALRMTTQTGAPCAV